MKKIIIFLSVFILTGCFNFGTGDLKTVCTKETTSNTLLEKNTYEISFKENIIDSVLVSFQFSDNKDQTTISALAQTYIQKSKFYENESGITVAGMHSQTDLFSIQYLITNPKEEILEEYYISNEHSQTVKNLEAKGFICK